MGKLNSHEECIWIRMIKMMFRARRIYVSIYTCNISRYTCQEGQDKCKSRFFFSPGLALGGSS